MKKLIEEEQIIEHDLKELAKYSNMLSKTIHDMNNPLSVFTGQLSLIEMMYDKGKLTPEKMVNAIQKLKSSSEKFQDHINLLKAFYKVPLNNKDFNKLGNIIESSIYYFHSTLYKHHIEIDLKVDKHAGFPIPGPHLFLCLKHLLQNAIEAVMDHKEPLISIQAHRTNELLTIKIKDNGEGLKTDFDTACRFGYSSKGDGFQGFGLSIVKALSVEHNFEIFYTYNDGAEFIINILDK